MRIGTDRAQRTALDGIAERRSKVLETQQQLASGRRVTRPSDDPVAAAEAERLRSRGHRIEVEQRAVSFARERLAAADTTIADATETLQQARETLLAAGNATASVGDRATAAEQLRQLRAQLLSAANRGDGVGGFVFGGQGALAPPFGATGASFAPQAGTQVVGAEMPSEVSLDGRGNFVAIPGPGGPESIFARLDAAIAVLASPATTAATAASAAGATVDAVDRAMERLSTTRTAVGERLRALDAHEQALTSGSIEASSRLSDLVDVDVATAVSEMVRHQSSLEAATRSYAQVAKLSLFDYL